MPCFHKIFVVLLLVAIAAASRSSHAAPIPIYDLDSLCLMSTDVVEATLIRHHQLGQEEYQDRFTATVVGPIAGHYHSGDQIASLDLSLYDPARTGHRYILFLARKPFNFHWRLAESSGAIAPPVVDMLLIDTHYRVRRYYQWMNPGGLRAEGYSDIVVLIPDHKFADHKFADHKFAEDDSAEVNYPTLTQERKNIKRRWARVGSLRTVLSPAPQHKKGSMLLNLLRQRRASHPRKDGDLEDGIAQILCCRLADLNDPSVAKTALSFKPDARAVQVSGLDRIAETPNFPSSAYSITLSGKPFSVGAENIRPKGEHKP